MWARCMEVRTHGAAGTGYVWLLAQGTGYRVWVAAGPGYRVHVWVAAGPGSGFDAQPASPACVSVCVCWPSLCFCMCLDELNNPDINIFIKAVNE